MTEEPWRKHTPGDPMPCKCGESVVEVRFYAGGIGTEIAKCWNWGKPKYGPDAEIIAWRFVERKGEDVIAADPDFSDWGVLELKGEDVIQRCAECDCEGGSSECNWIKSGPADPYAALSLDCVALVITSRKCSPTCKNTLSRGRMPRSTEKAGRFTNRTSIKTKVMHSSCSGRCARLC